MIYNQLTLVQFELKPIQGQCLVTYLQEFATPKTSVVKCMIDESLQKFCEDTYNKFLDLFQTIMSQILPQIYSQLALVQFVLKPLEGQD